MSAWTAPRFVVLGAGAIGAYVGAALVRGGADVTLIARGAQLDAMRERGVQVLSPRGDFAVAVDATDDLDAIAEADVLVVALKSYSLPGLATAIGERMRPGAALVVAQNGVPWWYASSLVPPHDSLTLESVDPGGALTAAIPPAEHVVGCVTYCSTEIAEPGVVRHVEGTRFAIGEPFVGAPSERCSAIAEAFVAGGLKCPIESDLGEQIWLKLIGNVAFNTVGALTRCTLEEMGRAASARELLRTLMAECASVASALGVELPVAIDHRLERGLAVGAHKPSTLQDLEAGKPLEVDCLTGAVIELAEQLDVQVPQSRAVHACIELLGGRAEGRNGTAEVAGRGTGAPDGYDNRVGGRAS